MLNPTFDLVPALCESGQMDKEALMETLRGKLEAAAKGKQIAVADQIGIGQSELSRFIGGKKTGFSGDGLLKILMFLEAEIVFPWDETLRLVTEPHRVGVSQTQSTTHSLYRGAYKGWKATVTDTTVRVPRQWLTRVYLRDLVLVDGLLTLDAAPADGAPRGVSLYAATWIVQRRGYSLTTERGYIASQGDIAYHGKDAVGALRGLRRKIKGAEWTAKLRTTSMPNLISALGDRAETLTVRVSDARQIGACEYGIRSWCHRCGLDYEAGAASLSAVYAAYVAHPVTEARAAILHALRRARVSLEA